jgi:hypothetical protein
MQAYRDNVTGTEPNRRTIKTRNHFKIISKVLYGSTLLHTPTRVSVTFYYFYWMISRMKSPRWSNVRNWLRRESEAFLFFFFFLHYLLFLRISGRKFPVPLCIQCSVTLYYSVLLFFFCVLYCSLFLYCTVSACDVRAATITEGFPCFFLNCKANARVELTKTEHGPHFPN